MDPHGRALELVDALRRGAPASSCPPDADIFDAHLHLGHDIDGMVGDYDQLEQLMAQLRHLARVHVLPRRARPASRRSAPRTTARSRSPSAREGRLIPFVRLDLNESPIEEATPLPRRRRPRDQAAPARAEVHGHRRAARAGVRARGRAPRADPDPRRPRPAADRRRPRALVEREPGRDADHRPRRDRRPRRPRRAAWPAARASSSTPRPGARSTCSTSTARCRPSRSSTPPTIPYGQQPSSLLIALRTARLAGFGRSQLRAMLGGTRERARRRRATCPSRRRRSGSETLAQPMQLARIHQYLSMATPLLWTRQPDTVGVLGLAINACAERNGHADDGRPHPRAARGGARPLGCRCPTIEDEDAAPRRDAPDASG